MKDNKDTVLEIGFFNDTLSELKKECLMENSYNSLIKKVEIFGDYGSYIYNYTNPDIGKYRTKEEYIDSQTKDEIGVSKIIKKVSQSKNDTFVEDDGIKKEIYTLIEEDDRKTVVAKIAMDITDYENELYDLQKELIITLLIGGFISLLYLFALKQYMDKPFSIIFNCIKAGKKVTSKSILNSKDELGTLAKIYNNSFDTQANTERLLSISNKRLHNHQLELEENIKEAIKKNQQQERQLIQQSKLAQMGEMISMIAHQWRQPLSAISASANLLQIKLMTGVKDDKIFAKKLNDIIEYTSFLSTTIDDFRNFYKPSKEKTITSLNQVVKNTWNIVGVAIRNKNIKLQVNSHESIEVLSLSSELQQVVLNLIKNAEDAILSNKIIDGKITVDIYKDEDKYGVIEVNDNAGGVPKEIADKIFEPYFSTKEKSDGTGLGLYMSKVIIEEHCGGKLLFTNNLDGASFKIKLIL